MANYEEKYLELMEYQAKMIIILKVVSSLIIPQSIKI
jgi:hypothetical protein